jgi:hypothetical protein
MIMNGEMMQAIVSCLKELSWNLPGETKKNNEKSQ